jgi:NAD(P)-dependent dehydrogenase (short-subunit alcohol dehydrogenase family)
MKDYQPPADLLHERIILVTGASGAVGSAAAKACAAHGATVVLLDRKQAVLERIYDEIVAAGHPQPMLWPMDYMKAPPEAYETIAAGLETELGRLDGLLHAAGVLGTLTPIEHYDMALWFQVMQVNFNAPLMLTRACLPLLKKSADASILFTADRAGRHGRAYWGAYGVSHAAIENLAEILHDELEVNTALRVNTLDTGPVYGPMRTLAYPGEDPNSIPKAEALMSDFLYLLGPDSHGVSGQRLTATASA